MLTWQTFSMRAALLTARENADLIDARAIDEGY